MHTAKQLTRRTVLVGGGFTAVAAASAFAVAATGAAPESAAWIDARPTATEFVGAGRSPDGSLVIAAPVRRSDPTNALLARLRVQGAAAAKRSTITAGRVARPTSIAASGESVFVLGSTLRGAPTGDVLGRVSLLGEVPGTKTLRGPAGRLGGLGRLDHRHVGAQWRTAGDDDLPNRAVSLDTTGYRFVGGKPFDGDASALTAVNTGTLVDLGSRVEWRPAGRPSELPADAYPSTLADGTKGDAVTGRIGAAADAGAIALQSTPTALLKEPVGDKVGDPVTIGLGDARLSVFARSGPARQFATPVPSGFEADCRSNALTVDTRDLVLSDPWNGPDGAIWAVAGCGRGRDDTFEENAPSSVDPAPIRWWLARWDATTFASSTLALPDPTASTRRSVHARGFMMADHAMWVLSMAGTVRVPLARPATPAVAAVRSVRKLAHDHVRVEISCIGTPGDGCFGRVTLSDRRGKLRTVSYGVDAGAAAMDPLVTREVVAPRQPAGKVVATLAP